MAENEEGVWTRAELVHRRRGNFDAANRCAEREHQLSTNSQYYVFHGMGGILKEKPQDDAWQGF